MHGADGGNVVGGWEVPGQCAGAGRDSASGGSAGSGLRVVKCAGCPRDWAGVEKAVDGSCPFAVDW